jgi:predicted membrane protein
VTGASANIGLPLTAFEAVRPTYWLSLLTALSFLLVAPFPLLLHLGHPERSFQIFLTPQLSSAMALFGFVYAWYLTGVLLLESGSSTGAN